MKEMPYFQGFHPVIKEWFLKEIGQPSMPQRLGWPEITNKKNVLICAPTGSGKTLAAFLKCLDVIFKTKKIGEKNEGVRVVYISPLKALNNDIYRNLELPILGIQNRALEEGMMLPDLDVAIRTGDTSQKERRQMLKTPPDILITTPESLFIMLTTKKARELFSTVEYVIVDEIHSIVANKRGVHLSLTLERLEELAGRKIGRIGLSATINPLEKVASYLGGYEKINGNEDEDYLFQPREVVLVNCKTDKKIDLTIEIPVDDLRSLPDKSIWPNIYHQLLNLISDHKSTLIFVNNRRHAEQVANGINNLVHEPFVKTHHGSMAKEVRHQLEQDFKRGEIRCLVATSTLELGIDIGHIELVVQVGAPNTTSQMVQRIGRSGHTLDAVSKGYVIPKTRADLLRAAFIGYEVGEYQMEYTNLPSHCLDVLAQQIISITCEGERDTEELYYMIKGSYSYRDLSYQQFEDLLFMLAYPSPQDEPGSIKPRIMYDRINGKIRGTRLGRMLALLGAGVIPDKGNYAVYEKGTNVRVGELQEEFVFETRVGERFFLGSSVWRLEAVEKDRVIVSQTKGSGGKLPFWIGDQVFWTYETGKRYADFLNELEKRIDQPDCLAWLQKRCSLGLNAAMNLQQYIKEQITDTGALQTRDKIICEYFGDEVGSQRIMIHSPFGGKVNGPLAIVLHDQLTKLLDSNVEYVYNDEGILFHILGYVDQLKNIFRLISRHSVKEDLIHLLPATPLFSMNLRYNLSRSLLISTKNGGKRVPLWIQRLRSAEMAQSISKISDHPIIVETYRECLQDLLDLESLILVLDQIYTDQIQVIDVYASKPSSFTSELSFNFHQIYQYVEDLPIAERRNQLLLTDQSVLDLAIGLEGEYELIDPKAVEIIEKELNQYRYQRKIKNIDDLYYWIYSFGELKAEPYFPTSFAQLEEACSAYLQELEMQKRIVRISLNGGEDLYWIVAEEVPLYLRGLGHYQKSDFRVKIGVPEKEKLYLLTDWFDSRLFEVEVSTLDAVTQILRRYLRFLKPFTIRDIQRRYQIQSFLIKRVLKKLISLGDLVILKESNSEEEKIYCNRKVYERIKKKTVELARNDIERKEKDVYLSFLFHYQKIGEGVLTGEEQLKKVIQTMQGLYLPVGWWESFVFPSRVNHYQPRMLDYLCSTGMVRWVGRMNKSRREVAFFMGEDFFTHYLVDSKKALLPEKQAEVYDFLKEKSACFLYEYAKLLQLTSHQTLELIEDLVWKGLITNDQFSPARYYEESSNKKSAWKKYNAFPEMGRWSAIDPTNDLSSEQILLNYINMLLDRYGILSKEIINLEKGMFKWSDVYTYLKEREFSSGIKRGFFVSGLSGIQFAREETIEELRVQERALQEVEKNHFVTISASDPANLYHIVKEESSQCKIKRHPGTVVVYANGDPVFSFKNYGKSMISYIEKLDLLQDAVDHFVEMYQQKKIWVDRSKIFLEYWGEENEPIETSPLTPILKSLGFVSEYKGMTLWPKL